MNSLSIKSLRTILAEVSTISIRKSGVAGCFEVKTKSEQQAGDACNKINEAGMYARILGFYPNLGFWLVGAARDRVQAGD